MNTIYDIHKLSKMISRYGLRSKKTHHIFAPLLKHADKINNKKTYLIMKKLFKHMATTSMMLAAILGTATSCQQEDDFAAEQPASKTRVKPNDTTNVAAKDTVLYFDNDFQYDESGIESMDKAINLEAFNKPEGKLKGTDGTTMLLNILKWGLEKGAAYAGTKGATEAIHAFIRDAHEENMQEIQEINGKLEAINNLLHEIEEKLDDKEKGDILNKHLEYNDKFGYHTINSLIDINRDTTNATASLYKWAETPTIHNRTYLTTINYLNFLSSRFNSKQLTLPQVYDDWIFKTTAWEHEGYSVRENMRLFDASVATSAYLMSLAYCVAEDEPYTIEALNRAYKHFVDVFEEYQVKRREDYRICQIKGANIIFQKYIITRDVYNHPWCKNSNWDNRDETQKTLMFGEDGVTAKYAIDRTMNLDEVRAIANYYNSGSSKMTFEDIMKEAGFNWWNLVYGMRHIMPLSNGISREADSVWPWNHDFDLKYNHVVDADLPAITVSNYNLGMMWLDGNMRSWTKYYPKNTLFFRLALIHRYNGSYPQI